jgi:4-oxalocrotonate tautomerase
MPILRVELFEGRTPAQKRAFAEAATRAACETLGCAPADVEVIFRDVARHDWAVAGRLASDPED